MKFIVKLFPEIMIKSETVRKRFAKILTSNIRNILQKYDEETAVVRHWDYIEVRSKNEANREELIALLQRIPGIHHFLEVEEKPFTDLHHIFELTLADVAAQLENGELPLEDVLKEFENGIKLAQLGQERLQQAEQRIQILLQKNETAPLSDYQGDE